MGVSGCLVTLPNCGSSRHNSAMSAKPTEPTAACVRDRIVAAAVQVLHEQGINALTQTRVSALAGVRQSHLTYYFPTRNDLLKQAVLSGVASLHAALDRPGETGGQSLQEFRNVLESQLADRRVPRMMAALTVASEEDPSLKPWLEQFAADMIDHLQHALALRGLQATRTQLEMFQATLVGALQLDLAASSAASSRRTRAILQQALDQLVVAAAGAGDSAEARKQRTARPHRAHSRTSQ